MALGKRSDERPRRRVGGREAHSGRCNPMKPSSSRRPFDAALKAIETSWNVRRNKNNRQAVISCQRRSEQPRRKECGHTHGGMKHKNTQ